MEQKRKAAMLSVLRDAEHTLGSAEITRRIRHLGIDVSPRTVRQYLSEMARTGLVTETRRGRGAGRRLTLEGAAAVRDAPVERRIVFAAARIDNRALEVTLDLGARIGGVVINVSFVDAASVSRAVDAMMPVFAADLAMGHSVRGFRPGEFIGDSAVPAGRFAFATVCDVTLKTVFLGAGIPLTARLGGVLRLVNGRPVRFTDVICYEGTSLSPVEVYIKSGLTEVAEAAATGDGRIAASFYEFPSATSAAVDRLLQRLRRSNLVGLLQTGEPGEPMLGLSVRGGYTGLVVSDGLNPMAAVEESGVPTENHALCRAYGFGDLTDYRVLRATV